VTLFDLPDDAAPSGPLVRVRMTVAYDGTEFHGFAAQPGLRTVAGLLEEALERVLGHRVSLTGAGRTDKGVHAWGQVVTFDAGTTQPLDTEAVRRALNKLCGPAIVVRDVAVADGDFDARFSARSRLYHYRVLNRDAPDPFLHRTTWWVPQPLDLAALRLASDPLIGEHDFSSFCRRPKGLGEREVSLVRRVLDARWIDEGAGLLRFEVEAAAFCHQMVRSLVGTLVAMGRGERRPGEMLAILQARDRRFTSNIAPPHGLCLWAVRY
jgi:tRNA pseudouridine38-40 synthase